VDDRVGVLDRRPLFGIGYEPPPRRDRGLGYLKRLGRADRAGETKAGKLLGQRRRRWDRRGVFLGSEGDPDDLPEARRGRKGIVEVLRVVDALGLGREVAEKIVEVGAGGKLFGGVLARVSVDGAHCGQRFNGEKEGVREARSPWFERDAPKPV
jgi:hypothetical protein